MQLKQTETCGEQTHSTSLRTSRTIGEIPDGWGVRKLAEFCDILMGQSPPSTTYNTTENGLPFFQGRKDFGGKYPTKTMWCSDPARIANSGDVLLSVRAPVGDVNVATEKCCIGRGVSALSIRNNNKEFLYYLLLHNQNRLRQIFESEGTVFGCVTKVGLKDFEVILPMDDKEQHAIAKILSDLDEKIELNHQMNKTLESIAQALFKRWFVDFKFPGYEKTKFVDGLPEGWRVGRFGELAKIQPGFAFKSSDFTTDGYKIVKIKNIQNGVVDTTQNEYVSDKIYQSVDKKFHLISGDVIVAMTGAEIGKIGIIPKIDGVMLLNQRVGKLVSDFYLWAYLMLNGWEIQSLIQGVSSASSAQPNISNSDIERTEVLIPDAEILKQFSKVGNGLYEIIISNLSEDRNLFQTRDSLLPRLMSGKIRVN